MDFRTFKTMLRENTSKKVCKESLLVKALLFYKTPISNLWEDCVLKKKIQSCRDITHFMTWLFYLKWIPLWSWDPQSEVTFICCAERSQIIIGPHSLIWGTRQWWCGRELMGREQLYLSSTAISLMHLHNICTRWTQRCIQPVVRVGFFAHPDPRCSSADISVMNCLSASKTICF